MLKKCILFFLVISLFVLSGCAHDSGRDNTSSSKSAENCGYEPIKTDPSKYENIDSDTLKQLNGRDVEIQYDPATNNPRSIDGIFSSYKIKTPEEALTALMGLRSIMKIEGDSFCCLDIDDSRTDLRVFTLCQLYNGVLVNNGLFQIYADKNDGTPDSVRGIYQPNISIDTTPGISSDEGLKSFTLQKKQKIKETTLVVYSLSDNSYVLCWKYKITSTDLAQSKIIYVSAVNGEIISQAPMAVN